MRILVSVVCLLLASCTSAPAGPDWQSVLSNSARPQEAEAYGDYLAARYAAISNEPSEAAVRYGRALQRSPANADVMEKAVYEWLLAGDFDKAAKLARQSREGPVDVAPIARLVTAIDAYRKGEYELVAELLQGKDLGAFNASLANLLIAWSFEARGDTETALMHLSQSNGDFVDQLKVFSQAYVLLHSGRNDEALATLQIATQSGLRLPMALAVEARLLLAEGREDDARELMQAVDVESAANTLLFDLKQQMDAGREFEDVKIDARAGAAMSLIVPIAALANRTGGDVSLAYLNMVLALDPTEHGATIMLADGLNRNDRESEALVALENVPAGSAYYGAAQSMLAWLYLSEEDKEKAKLAAANAVAASPARSIKVQVGDLYRTMEEFEQAEIVLVGVVENDQAVDRRDWRALFALGATRERLQKFDEAEEALKAALEIEPNRPEVLNYLGYSWIDRGKNIPEAFSLIRQAANLRPDAGYIVDSLGWAYYRMGRYTEAVRYLEHAASLDPDDAVINDHLGDAYWRIGWRVQARYQWERVKLFEPDEKTLSSVMEKLQSGLGPAVTNPGDGGVVQELEELN